MTPTIKKKSISNDQLVINIKEEPKGCDNPAMQVTRRISTISNPVLPEKEGAHKIENIRKESLKSVTSSKPKPEKEYNPYEHRNVKHPTSYAETLMHMLKATFGTGILAMADAFDNAGYVVGTVCTIAIGFLCTHVMKILIQSEYQLCKKKKVPCLTFSETAEAAFEEGPQSCRFLSSSIPLIIRFFLMIYEMGSCCIYIVFISKNLKDVVDQYQAPENQWDVRYYEALFLLPLLLLNSIRNLKVLAPFATAATAATFASFVLIFYYLFSEIPDFSHREAVAPIHKLPLYFGTVLFAMESIGMVMPLENEMKKPEQFISTFGVLNCAMVPITISYVLVGLFGYLKYGDTTQGSISLALPPTEKIAQAARLLLTFAIFISHALATYVPVNIIWHEILAPKVEKRKALCELVVRWTLVFIQFFFAVIIPDLELFISFIGAFCLSTLGLVFPVVIQLFANWHETEGLQFTLLFLKTVLVCILAAFGLVVGVSSSAKGIYWKYFA